MNIERRDALKAIGGIAGATVAGSTPAIGSQNEKYNLVEERAADHECIDECNPITREQRRLYIAIEGDTPVAQEILERSGFTSLTESFTAEICETSDLDTAEQIVEDYGTRLWSAAVNRAQRGESDDLADPGDDPLHQYDDRPLYWARLQMAATLRQWEPLFELRDENREHLIERLEYTSRGVTTTEFDGNDVIKVLVSGFDTFGLGSEIRRGNPSGAAILQLDECVLETDSGPAQVQAIMLPVRWEDFDEGFVEDGFGPHLEESDQQVDLLMTISQGGRGAMDIEGWAGNWRGGFRSANNLEFREGVVPPAPRWQQPEERIDWIETTLPVDAMMEVEEDPWEIIFDESVTGWEDPEGCPDPRFEPAIENQLTDLEEGPTAGMLPYSASGGNYLSNESMYRSNRLRIAFGLDDLPGGHLHVSSVQFEEDNETEITDSQWEMEVAGTADQTVELVAAAAGAVDIDY